MTYVTLAVTAAVAALVFTPLVRMLAARAGALDEPDGRRVHDVAVPRHGGVAEYERPAGGEVEVFDVAETVRQRSGGIRHAASLTGPAQLPRRPADPREPPAWRQGAVRDQSI